MTNSNIAIADVQSRMDKRRIAINKVGIKNYRHPLVILTREGEKQHTVGTFSMAVSLSAEHKGTHMSRFIDTLFDQEHALSITKFRELLEEIVTRLHSEKGYIDIEFPFFCQKKAPVSGVASYLDYRASMHGVIQPGHIDVAIKVLVPVTSLCPCSKEISAYGAHNQRSHVTVKVHIVDDLAIEDLIEIIESQASCDLYGSLKRVDEKFVTERAYENPKFVEDMVRDIAEKLNADSRISHYMVESENFESIHNHSAYAMIETKEP